MSTNVGPQHLLNIKTVTERRENMLWFRVPPKIYFKGGSMEVALRELKGKQRAFIVTDKPLYDMGYADLVTRVLDGINVHHQVRAAGGGEACCAVWLRSGLGSGRPSMHTMLGVQAVNVGPCMPGINAS